MDVEQGSQRQEVAWELCAYYYKDLTEYLEHLIPVHKDI